jgi:hypothetical protein
MPTYQSESSGYRFWSESPSATVRLEFQGRAGEWVCNTCYAVVNEAPAQTFDVRAYQHVGSHQP